MDKRTDIWAFGVVLYELLTGRLLFGGGETISDTLAAVLMTEPDWSAMPPDTPPAIRRLLRRCLERDRKKRLSDIADARLELDEALAGSPEASQAAAAPTAPPAPRSVSRWWISAAAVMTLAALTLAVLHFSETPTQPFPVRFQIPLPDSATPGSIGMALSPDGRRLAFIAMGAQGRRMLWVRPLDSVAAQELPGTEGASYLPFWSPDSRSIGFLVRGSVRKIDASGGPPQTLCEVPGLLTGGSWSRDGVIIFGSNAGGLSRVPQAGGVATQLTTVDESRGEIGHLRPWFLPDGRHFLYYARTRQEETTGIYLATLDGKERKHLVPASQAGAYAPPVAGSEHGHLLFLRQKTLMALPLDAKSFGPAGEPFPVAEQVGSVRAMGSFSVSGNGVLAFRGGTSSDSQLVWFDRQGKSLATLGPPALYAGVALSPEGKRVAVDQTDSTGNRDIWVLDVARGVPTRFTFDATQEHSPAWSPDGTRLAFAANRGNTDARDIYQKDSSGSGNEELLLKTGAFNAPHSWSPDSRYLLYSSDDFKVRAGPVGVIGPGGLEGRPQAPAVHQDAVQRGPRAVLSGWPLDSLCFERIRFASRLRAVIPGRRRQVPGVHGSGRRPAEVAPRWKGDILYRCGRPADGRGRENGAPVRGRRSARAFRSADCRPERGGRCC